MITEYGADTVAGIHECVPEMFSEEFQVEFYKRQNAQFDKKILYRGTCLELCGLCDCAGMHESRWK